MTSSSPTPDLAEATTLHQAGKLADAGVIYQRILAQSPQNYDAMHGLALVAVDLDQPDRALPLLFRCLAAAPTHPIYHASTGLAYLRKGDAEQAAAHFLEAANRAPHLLEPRLYLARALGNLGRWNEAADILAVTAPNFPDRVEGWAAKGNAERMTQRHKWAEASLRHALTLAPDDPDILNNLGVVVRALGRTEEAIGYYRQALEHAPDSALLHTNIGNALTYLRHNASGEAHLRLAVDLDPAGIEPRNNLAVYLTQDQRPEEAIPHFRVVLAAAPDNADALTNLGLALLDTGSIGEAEQSYRRAIAAQPKNAEAHYNLAWLLLLTGRWPEGWREYEWRWKLTNFSSRKRKFSQPQWNGAPLPNGTLLLHAEQGIGDSIQFVRYATLAKSRCARVIVECPSALTRLFERIDGVDSVVAAGVPLPAFNAHAPFMSLPGLFDTTPETVPGREPYVAAPAIPPHLVLPKTSRKRIGIVWAGSPDNKIDRRRTLPARLFAPLLQSHAVDIVSLQVGSRADEVRDLPQTQLVFACDGHVADFTETAAVISQLDLVIGVDTAVMHLAAAMGKPTWMLVPFMPDYRWLLDRTDTPWYPPIKLFRQEKMGDWTTPLAAVAAALTKSQAGPG
jgi:tetratricopeptide (TPR) repeat protein